MAISVLNQRGVWVAVGAVVVILALGLFDRVRAWRVVETPAQGAWETDPVLWGRLHPRQYHSWRLGQERSMTGVGQGADRARWTRTTRTFDPALFAGYSAAEGPPVARGEGHPVSCLSCHDPQTMELRITQPAFQEELQRRRMDATRLTHEALRTYVCAQCHAANSGRRVGSRATIALSVEDLLGWAAHEEPALWRHELSGTPLVKVLRPEHALWREGIHAVRGVTCVDCHMPYISEGTARFTDHGIASPIRDVHAACARCHRAGEAALRSQVEALQKTTDELQQRASQALRDAHAAVARARRLGAHEEALHGIQARLRQAQLRWDFIASEGSAGFHAPQEATRLLAEAIDGARQAEVEARRLP